MKTILSILLCFGFVFCKGQKDTVLKEEYKLPDKYVDGKSVYSENIDNMDVRLSFERDTIPCLIMVAESVKGYPREEVAVIKKGYEIVEIHNEAENVIDSGFCIGCVYKNYYVHIKYLDKNKKYIPDNKVWICQRGKTVN